MYVKVVVSEALYCSYFMVSICTVGGAVSLIVLYIDVLKLC